MYKILIVEDDAAIEGAIITQLHSWGYACQGIADFQNVLKAFAAFTPDLVLMDISLPFFNGYHWCREIRRLSKVPILFLSSASDSMNQVMAIEMGADDFISKPFDMSLLIAKTQALLRRAYEFQGASHLISHGNGVLNLSQGLFTYEEKSVSLTKNELRILQTLMEAGGAVVSRDQIMQKLWETDCFVDDNTLTVNVTRLRKTLESIGLNDYVQTQKGIGYRVG
jgi:Response regulators consisting of a CheY-like receiver domain and a winged-helix DNA-binding domain